MRSLAAQLPRRGSSLRRTFYVETFLRHYFSVAFDSSHKCETDNVLLWDLLYYIIIILRNIYNSIEFHTVQHYEHPLICVLIFALGVYFFCKSILSRVNPEYLAKNHLADHKTQDNQHCTILFVQVL